MTTISSDMLKDTYNLLALARQAALQRGNQAQADQLGSVAKELRPLAASTPQIAQSPATAAAQPVESGMLGQSDFQLLLKVTQTGSQSSGASLEDALQRNRMVTAMAQGGMGETDIARHFGLTRDEVHLIVNLGANNQAGTGGVK